MPRTLPSRGIVLCSCTPRTEPRVFSSPAVCSALSRRESILVCTFPLFRDKSASTGKFVVHSLVRLKAPKSHVTSQETPLVSLFYTRPPPERSRTRLQEHSHPNRDECTRPHTLLDATSAVPLVSRQKHSYLCAGKLSRQTDTRLFYSTAVQLQPVVRIQALRLL